MGFLLSAIVIAGIFFAGASKPKPSSENGGAHQDSQGEELPENMRLFPGEGWVQRGVIVEYGVTATETQIDYMEDQMVLTAEDLPDLRFQLVSGEGEGITVAAVYEGASTIDQDPNHDLFQTLFNDAVDEVIANT